MAFGASDLWLGVVIAIGCLVDRGDTRIEWYDGGGTISSGGDFAFSILVRLELFSFFVRASSIVLRPAPSAYRTSFDLSAHLVRTATYRSQGYGTTEPRVFAVAGLADMQSKVGTFLAQREPLSCGNRGKVIPPWRDLSCRSGQPHQEPRAGSVGFLR